ncbi:MAG: hypothetical protein ACLFOY_17075 [Desulfatibacillaceae bacterium]
MGFIRRQEVRLAMRYIGRQYDKSGASSPPEAELRARAEQLVDDAHRVARQSGRNFGSILKDLVADIQGGKEPVDGGKQTNTNHAGAERSGPGKPEGE